MSRAIRRSLRVARGEKLPVLAGHKLLYRCNLTCDMCPFWRRPDRELLTLEQEETIFRRLADAGVLFLGFEGGEPLLRPDLPAILAEAHERFHTSLVTNGFLLERRWPELEPGLDSLFVSLDGIGPLHDRLRGIRGSFDRAVRGIRRAAGDLPVTISCTLTRFNLHQADQMVSLARGLGASVVFQLAFDYRTAGTLSPQGTDLESTLQRLRDLKRRGAPITNSEDYFTGLLSSWFHGGPKWECRPWLTVNIDPSGQIVLPCYVLQEYHGERDILATDIPHLWATINWDRYRSCNRCALSCYLEPSLFRWTRPAHLFERILSPAAGEIRRWTRRAVRGAG